MPDFTEKEKSTIAFLTAEMIEMTLAIHKMDDTENKLKLLKWMAASSHLLSDVVQYGGPKDEKDESDIDIIKIS